MAENEELISYIKSAFELRNQECYKQAIEMLYKAIAIEPDNVEILYQIGELYYLLNNYSRALQYPNQILLQDENHIQSLTLLKNIYLKQEELFSAKEIAEKIYKLDAAEKNLASIVRIYGKLELFDEIEAYLPEINKSKLCLFELAKAYYNSGNFDKSEEIIDIIAKSGDEDEECLVLKGKILFDKNKFDEAKEIFEKFGMLSDNPDVLNYKGLFAMDDMKFIDAIKFFSKALSIRKNNAQYAYNLANAYFLNGWYDEAVTSYKNAIYIAPDNIEYRYSLAYAYYEHNEIEKARKEIDVVLETNPNHVGAKVIKALILFENKNYIEAEKILLSNVLEDNTDEFTLSSLAKIENELGKFESAEKHIKAVLEKAPDNINYLFILGDVFIKAKKYDEAVDIANKITDMNDKYIDGYMLGAESSYAAAKYAETKNFAQSALSIDINCSKAYFYLALVRMKEEDFDEAVECMKRAIIHDISNPKYYAGMAEIYKLKGDNKTAFDYVKEAESIDDSEEYKLLYKEYAALNRK